jgi:hypothetical protein
MRGKLRDKRAETKRDNFKRELMERRRTSKRDNRTIIIQLSQLDQDDDYLLEEEPELLVENAKR